MFLPCIRFSSRPALRAPLSSAERSIRARSSSGVKSSSFRKLRPCIAFTAAGASLLSMLMSPPSRSIYDQPPGGPRPRSKALDKCSVGWERGVDGALGGDSGAHKPRVHPLVALHGVRVPREPALGTLRPRHGANLEVVCHRGGVERVPVGCRPCGRLSYHRNSGTGSGW